MRGQTEARGPVFADRHDAGRQLAERIKPLDLLNPVVIALPRGGVPVGYEVAEAIAAPLDTLVVRKLGAPSNPEYAVGAITEDGILVTGHPRDLSVSEAELSEIARRERIEAARRVSEYRGGRPLVSVVGRDVVLVDDGIATGLTALAAARSLRSRGARRIVLASPICSADIAQRFSRDVERVVCVFSPINLMAVGLWYTDFSPTTDEEVITLLRESAPPEGTDGEDGADGGLRRSA